MEKNGTQRLLHYTQSDMKNKYLSNNIRPIATGLFTVDELTYVA